MTTTETDRIARAYFDTWSTRGDSVGLGRGHCCSFVASGLAICSAGWPVG